ncbi:MAG: putative lipid II flippase FtsW [Verrucomicrobiaceae bacterium]|nr:MAG: putative lipid II flippase FtsW [Verrucomicrobiaceae bacterium]
MHRKSVYFLVLAVAALLVLGVVMLFSTSAFAQDAHGNPMFFIKRQAMWLGVGVIVCIAAALIDYHFWQKTWWIWFVLSAVLLLLCFVPPIGQRINGSARWIKLGFTNFQPSELAKLAAIAGLAWWFARDDLAAREFRRGFLYPIAGVSVLMVLIVFEIDLGATALIGATTYMIMFVAGTRLRYLVPLVVLGLVALGLAIVYMPERTGRFLAFLYPETYPKDAYQARQGLIALGSGGVEGLGLGNGRQKMAYLPFAHTDFIFPMIGEELGLRATLAVVFTYIVIVLCGGIISVHARDRFGLLLGFGFTTLIALQAAVNIGVTTELLPNKGMPLPLISYGGSNLVLCLLGIGILISIYRQGISDRSTAATVRLAARTRPRVVRI